MKLNKRNWLFRTAALTAAVCMLAAGTCFAEEAAEPAEAAEVKTIGTADGAGVQVELINSTGYDITLIKVEKYAGEKDSSEGVRILQEKLIEEGYYEGEADGFYGDATLAAVTAYRVANGLPEEGGTDEEMLTLMFGEGYDGNMLEKDDVFASGETRILYWTEPESEETEDEAETASDPIAEILVQHDVPPTDTLTVKMAGIDTEFVLYAFVPEYTDVIELLYEGGILFVHYVSEDLEGGYASTYKTEKAVYDYQNPVVYNYGSYDDYSYNTYDYSYDYSYDYNAGAAQGADGCVEDGLFN